MAWGLFEIQGVSAVLTQNRPTETDQNFARWKTNDVKAYLLGSNVVRLTSE